MIADDCCSVAGTPGAGGCGRVPAAPQTRGARAGPVPAAVTESAVRVLALAQLIDPPYRTAYGLTEGDVDPGHRFIFDGLVRDGLAERRPAQYFEGRLVAEACWMITRAGAELLQAALERAR
jgi:hypothetical protein